jgi:hypothetical protein
VDIEFIFICIGIRVQDLVELLHLSQCTHITRWELLNRFSWNLILENLRKIVELLQFSFREAGYFSSHLTRRPACVPTYIPRITFWVFVGAQYV